jgi:DNA polymerase III subunit delta'
MTTSSGNDIKNIQGQDAVMKLLQEEWVNKKRRGSYLLEGPKGVGKFTATRWLIQKLLCENPLAQPCGECNSCNKLRRFTHPDLMLLTPTKGIISIETVREVFNHLQFPPLEASCRIVIIDDADSMNHFAANALLKTLEEPPPHALLILIASQPTALPATVLSRLKRFRFAPLTPEVRAVILDIPKEDAQLLRVIDAEEEIETLQNRLSHLKKAKKVIIDALKKSFTLQNQQLSIQPVGLWELASELLAEDEDLTLRLQILQSVFRDLHYIKHAADAGCLTHTDELAFLQQIADKIGAQPLSDLCDRGERLIYAVRHSHVNHRIAVEYCISNLEALQ